MKKAGSGGVSDLDFHGQKPGLGRGLGLGPRVGLGRRPSLSLVLARACLGKAPRCGHRRGTKCAGAWVGWEWVGGCWLGVAVEWLGHAGCFKRAVALELWSCCLRKIEDRSDCSFPRSLFPSRWPAVVQREGGKEGLEYKNHVCGWLCGGLDAAALLKRMDQSACLP